MIGIVSCGVYIPQYRLSRDLIASTWGMPSRGGEKAVANCDEDAVTMCVEATLNCIEDLDSGNIDGLFFASTTAPYKEKQAASLVAVTCDLKRAIKTADFGSSLRSASIAMNCAVDAVRGGSAKQVIVTAGDCRIPQPESGEEQIFGDGAAALLIGDTNVIAEVSGIYTHMDEFTDVWSKDKDLYVRSSGDARFDLNCGYLRNMKEAISEILGGHNLQPKDFAKVVLYSPDGRGHLGLAKMAGFETGQIQDPMFQSVGNTGTALVPMMLVSALEEAKAGDKILVVSYGDGCDAFIVDITSDIENMSNRRGMKDCLKMRRELKSYVRYLRLRDLIKKED